MPPDLFGPSALLVAALIAVGVLWRDHIRADADDRAQRDRLLAITEGLIPTVKELAEGMAALNREAAARQRRDDP